MGCHFLLQGIFPTQGSNLSPALVGGFFTTEPPGKPLLIRGLLSLKVFSDSLYNVLDATSSGPNAVFVNAKYFCAFIRTCRVPSCSI